MKASIQFTRRHFLRNASVTLALPFLPSFRQKGFAKSIEKKPVQRVAFIYTPNGYNQETFLPEKTGPDWTLPKALEPLSSIKDQVTLISGLDRQFVPGTGVHAQCGACWLTSSPPHETLDGGFPTNLTLDQMIARKLGRSTLLPSLELSCNDFTDNKETKYFESISWYGPGYAANVAKNPRDVFRRLFGQTQGDPQTRSVLDVILQEAKSLKTKLGREDQQKIEEYLESVRATERRIQLAEQAASRLEHPPIKEPKGIPERRDDYLRLMTDLMVFAFQLDLTRVATLVVDPERWDSPRMFHGVFDRPQNHHVLTHTKGEEAKQKITEIDRFHVQQFTYFVEKLKSIQEGDGTLLDQCVVSMGSGISDGDKHVYADLQVLLAGGGGGHLKQGQALHFKGDRPLSDLWLTLAQGTGIQADRFADSTGILKEILV